MHVCIHVSIYYKSTKPKAISLKQKYKTGTNAFEVFETNRDTPDTIQVQPSIPQKWGEGGE